MDPDEQAWSIKDLLYGIKHQNIINFHFGKKPVIWAGKSKRGILFILPAHGASYCPRRVLAQRRKPEEASL